MANYTQLIPVQELAPGELGAIRNEIVKASLNKASAKLGLPISDLVVRDIRPQSDLDWGSDATTGLANVAVTTDIWVLTSDASLSGFLPLITSASAIMATDRFITIYGLRDGRYTDGTIAAQSTTLWKIVVGNSTKAIWDLSKCYAYKDMPCGVCPSGVFIPERTQFQIYGYSIATSTLTYVMVEGIVVEPRGLVISP